MQAQFKTVRMPRTSHPIADMSAGLQDKTTEQSKVAIILEGLLHQEQDLLSLEALQEALMDALLGCIGAGDIGTFFPDSDPAFDNVNSAVLLDTVLEHVQKANVHITHVDLTVIAQIPKVGPHREMIRRNVARLLGLDMGAVNVKATTEEGLGFTGERLGIKAVAVVTGLRGNRDT